MYTQCPHCRSIYRVGADALAAARGELRCGNCGKLFDGFATLTERLPDQIDALPRRSFEANAPLLAVAAYTPPDAAPDPLDLLPTPGPDIRREPELPRVLPREALIEAGVLPESMGRRAPTLEPATPGFAADYRPDRLQEGRAAGVGSFAGLLMLGLGGLATAQLALLAQSWWLPSFPQLEVWLSRACEPIGCRIGRPQDWSQIRLVGKGVHSTPARPDVVTLLGSLQNAGVSATPWPEIEVVALDHLGNTVAVRRFSAPDYLSGPEMTRQSFAPASMVPVQFDLVSPPNATGGFRFEVAGR
ncbi:MAG: DUF3426 domain-containing protein [Xanthomonadales bacterium]|jgi:predicted Zn finger-like uncharacterized protein|nr:DUF3426 domain-containing protein [Xanthomonadales bacterium]